MTVTSIKRDYGPGVSIVRIVTDEPLENIIRGGWLATQEASITEANNGPFEWNDGDAVLVQYPTGLINGSTGREILATVLTYVFPSFVSLNPIGPLYPTNFNAVAHTGGGQANATNINPGTNIVISSSAPGDSVKLPSDVLGQTVIVLNISANSIDVFPSDQDNIDNGAVNAAYPLASTGRVIFIGTGIDKWSSFALATNS